MLGLQRRFSMCRHLGWGWGHLQQVKRVSGLVYLETSSVFSPPSSDSASSSNCHYLPLLWLDGIFLFPIRLLGVHRSGEFFYLFWAVVRASIFSRHPHCGSGFTVPGLLFLVGLCCLELSIPPCFWASQVRPAPVWVPRCCLPVRR